jgi:hypothetical protein
VQQWVAQQALLSATIRVTAMLSVALRLELPLAPSLGRLQTITTSFF